MNYHVERMARNWRSSGTYNTMTQAWELVNLLRDDVILAQWIAQMIQVCYKNGAVVSSPSCSVIGFLVFYFILFSQYPDCWKWKWRYVFSLGFLNWKWGRPADRNAYMFTLDSGRLNCTLDAACDYNIITLKLLGVSDTTMETKNRFPSGVWRWSLYPLLLPQ